jgi:hypothetical protein
MTFKANKELLSKIMDLFIETIEPIKGIPGLFPSFVMQPITQIARANRHKNGGNPFGIKEEDGPLISQQHLFFFTSLYLLMHRSLTNILTRNK